MPTYRDFSFKAPVLSSDLVPRIQWIRDYTMIGIGKANLDPSTEHVLGRHGAR